MTSPRTLCTLHVLGDVMVDVIARVDDDPVRGSDRHATIRDAHGGSAANVASWLAHLGARVELIARVGNDTYGEAALARLAESGVTLRVTVDSHRPTGRCIVIVTPDGERTMLPDAGANAALEVTDLNTDDWQPGSHLHVSGYSLLNDDARPAALAALDAARARSLTVSLDASSAAPLLDVGPDRFLGWLQPGDILFANADEARALTSRSEPGACAAALAARGILAVVKVGANGALAARADEVWVSAGLAARASDTTGAGDAFAAAFLAAWTGGRDVGAAMDHATRIAAHAVDQPGGRP
jgi:ribokinase